MAGKTIGHQHKWGAGTTGVAVTEKYLLVAGDVVKRGTVLQAEGVEGTRSYRHENAVKDQYVVGGTVTLHPTPVDLVAWLPRILGAAASGTTFALAETVPEFRVTHHKVSKNYDYDGCKVNSATFRSSAGSPKLSLEMDIQGKTETQNTDAFPSIEISTLQPYVHSQLVLTLGGTAYTVEDIAININNFLQLDRFFNSTTRVDLLEGDREITMSCLFPFGTDEAALYDLAIAGVAGTAVWTNGAYSITFTFAKLQAPAETAPFAGRRGETKLRVNFNARAISTAGAITTRELVVTNDSTG